MSTLTVELGDRSYPIYIGESLANFEQLMVDTLGAIDPQQQILIVSNDVVAPLYLDSLTNALKDYRVKTVVLTDGEEAKTLTAVDKIITALLEARFNRHCLLVALGGGVVGDITGFAAACYQRGVDFLQIPTTLLSQVDSSVGGKTGVNHALGKNMIGAFHQPRLVTIDIATLETLPPREFGAGVAEVIKYGLIADSQFFEWLEDNIDALINRERDALIHAIEVSCRTKARVVSEDEKESGIRAILNLGHTFGHAIETGAGYGKWLHGEAVAIGMCLAAKMSHGCGWIDETALLRAYELIRRAKLPTELPAELSAEEMKSLMKVDKKNHGDRIRLVLLKAIGSAVITDEYDDRQLDLVLQQ